MKIVIGVCGIGYGHCSREIEVAEKLRKLGHAVMIFGFGTSIKFFSERNYDVVRIWVPIVRPGSDGVSLRRIIRDNCDKIIPGLIRNLVVFFKIIITKEHIDLYISDYEPVSALFARMTGVPSITIDQQSKYRYFQFPNIENLNQMEEKNRLSFFFPSSTKSFICSFHKIQNDLGSAVEVLPPILRDEIMELKVTEEPLILVYFSNFLGTSISQEYDVLLKIFERFPDFTFHIYSDRTFENFQLPLNVQIFPISGPQFLEDLARCSGVISTAGHTLISEALYMSKPLFLIPIVTYDQHFCAWYIRTHKLGISALEISNENMREFITNIDSYREHIRSTPILNTKENGIDRIILYITKKEWQT